MLAIHQRPNLDLKALGEQIHKEIGYNIYHERYGMGIYEAVRQIDDGGGVLYLTAGGWSVKGKPDRRNCDCQVFFLNTPLGPSELWAIRLITDAMIANGQLLRKDALGD